MSGEIARPDQVEMNETVRVPGPVTSILARGAGSFKVSATMEYCFGGGIWNPKRQRGGLVISGPIDFDSGETGTEAPVGWSGLIGDF